jgi:hypothetical protein
MNGYEVGFMGLDFARADGRRVLAVDYVSVSAPRCGIGTKIYQRALQLACDHKVKLASGSRRTGASEHFWRKQVRKRRAHCIITDEPADRLYDDGEKFHTMGEWPCGRYAMREACPRKMDLSGRRRR